MRLSIRQKRTGQATFSVFTTEYPKVLYCEGLGLDRGLESLSTSPGHVPGIQSGNRINRVRLVRNVLNSDASSLSDEDEILSEGENGDSSAASASEENIKCVQPDHVQQPSSLTSQLRSA